MSTLSAFFATSKETYGAEKIEKNTNTKGVSSSRLQVPAALKESMEAAAREKKAAAPKEVKKIKKKKHKKIRAEAEAAALAAQEAESINKYVAENEPATEPATEPEATTEPATELVVTTEPITDTEAAGTTEPESQSAVDRTVFIGNVPLNVSTKALSRFFTTTHGVVVETIRLRSVPIAGCAVLQAGNSAAVRKVCTITKNFIEGRDTCNAYMRLSSLSAVSKIVSLKTVLFEKSVLKVDFATPTVNSKHSVFLGNIPFDAKEHEIVSLFQKAIIEKSSIIEKKDLLTMSCRLIRDASTGLGKGFGYLTVSDLDTVSQVLSLPLLKLRKRELRVSVCGKRTKGKMGKEEVNDGGRKEDGASRRVLNNKRPAVKRPYVKQPYAKNMKRPFEATKTNKTSNKSLKSSEKKVKKPKHAARKAAQAQQRMIEASL